MSCNVNVDEISKCQQSVLLLQQAIDEDNRNYYAYVAALKKWENADNEWRTAVEDIKARAESAKYAGPGHVWVGDVNVNCGNISRNCWDSVSCATSDASLHRCDQSSEAAKRCTSCGYTKCGCNNETWDCKTSNCQNYQYKQISPLYAQVDHMVAQYNTWQAKSPRPTEYVRRTSYPNIVCTACVQCAQFGNITTSGDVVLSQAQECISRMQTAADIKETSTPTPPVEEQPQPQPQPQPVVVITPTPDKKYRYMLLIALALLAVIAAVVYHNYSYFNAAVVSAFEVAAL